MLVLLLIGSAFADVAPGGGGCKCDAGSGAAVGSAAAALVAVLASRRR